MNPAAVQSVLNSPFVQITLPLLVPIVWGFVWQNRRFDRMEDRLDADLKEIRNELASHGRQLAAIDIELKHHGERLTRLEERIPPLVHR